MVRKALNLGAAGYIIKATTRPNEVVEQIKKVLRQKPKVEGITHYAVEIREAPMMRKNLSQISIFRN